MELDKEYVKNACVLNLVCVDSSLNRPGVKTFQKNIFY